MRVFFSLQQEGKDTQQELNEDLKGAMLAAYQGPHYLHTKGTRHLGENLCGALLLSSAELVPREFSLSQKWGF